MPAYIEICWGPKLVWKGREYLYLRRCIKIPLYVEVIELPPVPVPPWKRFIDDFVVQLEGATVGPAVRDLGRAVFLLQALDGFEDSDMRSKLQESVAAYVTDIAREALPDAQVEIELDQERERTPGLS